MHMVFGSIYLAWFGFILDLILCGISLAKLLFNFMLEKQHVLIEMLLVLFKIVAYISFIHHIQVQTIGLKPS